LSDIGISELIVINGPMSGPHEKIEETLNGKVDSPPDEIKTPYHLVKKMETEEPSEKIRPKGVTLKPEWR